MTERIAMTPTRRPASAARLSPTAGNDWPAPRLGWHAERQIFFAKQRLFAALSYLLLDNGVCGRARATILPGVTVGAGAVVTRDVPPDTLVAGVPAKVMRALDAEP